MQSKWNMAFGVPMQRRQQSVRAHDDRAFWQLVIVLLDTLEVVARRICLANCAGCEVQDLISIAADIRVELGNTEMCPIAPNHRENVTECIRPATTSLSGERLPETTMTYFVMVPSMSEMTTWSVCSQTNRRAVHAATPVADRENVMLFAPGFRSSDF